MHDDVAGAGFVDEQTAGDRSVFLRRRCWWGRRCGGCRRGRLFHWLTSCCSSLVGRRRNRRGCNSGRWFGRRCGCCFRRRRGGGGCPWCRRGNRSLRHGSVYRRLAGAGKLSEVLLQTLQGLPGPGLHAHAMRHEVGAAARLDRTDLLLARLRLCGARQQSQNDAHDHARGCSACSHTVHCQSSLPKTIGQHVRASAAAAPTTFNVAASRGRG